MLVIGIAGKKRSGKDTVARMIMDCANRMGVKSTRRALADALKEECASVLATHLLSDEQDAWVASDILTEMNNDATKEKYRLLLQWWGTEFRRGMVSETYWIDKLRTWILKQVTTEIVLVPDVRFPNEVEMIEQLGGVVIKVDRSSSPLSSDKDIHPSETALDAFEYWDDIIYNDYGLSVLQNNVEQWFFDHVQEKLK